MDRQPTEAEWRSWLHSHGSSFWLFARQQARTEMDAEDLVQEAIVEAARRAGSAPPAPAVVFATIRRRAVDRARSDDRRMAREFASVEGRAAWFDETPEQRERAMLIQDAVGKLRAEYREVLTLKIWGGLTFVEIAMALEIPANTAASRYRYGLEQLRQLTREVLHE